MITKIQSYTDVITNSSSTVFIMHEENAKFYEKDTPCGCCRIEYIGESWVRNNLWEWPIILDYLDISYDDLTTKREIENPPCWYAESDFYHDPSEEDWNAWIDMNLERLEKDLFGLYWVNIDDSFEGSYEYTKDAEKDALISDYRH